MSDHVRINNLRVHGFHGVFDEERRNGQEFFLDIDCSIDVSVSAAQDDYTKAVCYGALCDLAVQVSDDGPYQLIETFAERVANAILQQFDPVNEVTVRVRKPSAPLSVQVDHAEVEVSRQRQYPFAVSLGSNMGDKQAQLLSALQLIGAEDGVVVEQLSSFYRTAPWGQQEQDWFVNACACGTTTRDPLSLLKAFKRIEVQLGRVPGERWGPRAIDIDLLYVGELRHEGAWLTLPHPEMFNRAFVLVPLAEIAPEQQVSGRSIKAALDALDYDPADVTAL